MKKIIVIILCIFLIGCGEANEKYSEVSKAYENLICKNEMSYEVIFFLGSNSEPQRYVVNQMGTDWNYKLFIGKDALLQERKGKDGNSYFRALGESEWIQDTTEYELSFFDEILVDVNQIEKITINDNGKEIIVTLNQDALDEMKNNTILAGEAAITNLINAGVSEEVIEVQKKHNQLLERTTYHKDERKYYIDENGVLTKYIRTVLLEKPNQENKMEEESTNITILINSYK